MKTFPTPVLPADAKATAAESAIATIDGAYKAADSALATRVGTAEKAIADNKIAVDTAISNETTARTNADKAIADAATALAARVAALETPSTNNTNYLVSGSPYTAASAIGLRGLVHIRADGKIEPADDTVATKPANGVVDAPIAAGASGNVYGTGARFSAVGLSGTQPGSQLFTGSAGAISLSSVGNGRMIQQIGIFKSSLYYFDFSDAGYWIEAL